MEDTRTRYDGLLWAMKPGMFGRQKWNEVYTFVDEYRLVQWKDKEKPRSYRIKPILEASFEKFDLIKFRDNDKPFGFRLIERKPGTKQYVYACDNERDYKLLLNLMTRQANYRNEKQQRQQNEMNDGFENIYGDNDDFGVNDSFNYDDNAEDLNNDDFDGNKDSLNSRKYQDMDIDEVTSQDQGSPRNKFQMNPMKARTSLQQQTIKNPPISPLSLPKRPNASGMTNFSTSPRSSLQGIFNDVSTDRDNSNDSKRGSIMKMSVQGRASVLKNTPLNRRSLQPKDNEYQSKANEDDQSMYSSNLGSTSIKANEPKQSPYRSSESDTRSIRMRERQNQPDPYDDNNEDKSDFAESPRNLNEDYNMKTDQSDEEEEVKRPDMLRFDGVLLKLKAGLFGRSTWSPKWAHIDEKIVVQFTGSNRPSNYQEKPSYVFALQECYIEPYVNVYQGQRFVFKILPNDDYKKPCIYACKEDIFQFVMPLLTKNCMKRRQSMVKPVPAQSVKSEGIRDSFVEPRTTVNEKESSAKSSPSLESKPDDKASGSMFDIDDEIKHYADDEYYVPPVKEPQTLNPLANQRSSMVPNVPDRRMSSLNQAIKPSIPHPNVPEKEYDPVPSKRMSAMPTNDRRASSINRATQSIHTPPPTKIEPIKSRPITPIVEDPIILSDTEIDNLSELSDFMPLHEDIIMDHFDKFNSSSQTSLDGATTTFFQIKALLKSLNAAGKHYVNPNGAIIIYRDLQIPVGKDISCIEFVSWWQEFVLTQDIDMRKMRSLMYDRIHQVSTTRRSPSMKLTPLTTAMIKMPIINVKSIEKYPLKKPSMEDDWNAIYQRALDIASGLEDLSKKPTIIPVDRNVDAIINAPKRSSYKRKKFYLDLQLQHNSYDEFDSEENKNIANLDIVDKHNSPTWTPIEQSVASQRAIETGCIGNLLNFQSFMGSFYRSAIEGTKLIMDEYILPDYLKSTSVFRIPLSATSSSKLALSKMFPNIFGYDGLIFRIVDIVASEDPSKALPSGIIHSISNDPNGYEDINRKLILQEYLGKNALIEVNLRVLDRYLEASSTMTTSQARPILKTSTLLSTIVDYCGYRIYVLAPADVSETKSLLHGYCLSIGPVAIPSNMQSSSLPASPFSTSSPMSIVRRSLQSKDDKGSPRQSVSNTIISLNQKKSYPFVDSSISRRQSIETEILRKGIVNLYDQIADEMNLELNSYDSLSTSSTAAAIKNNYGHVRTFRLLSKYLQIHQCPDNRRYLLNTGNILPAENPQKNSSFDSFIKKFRFEYIQSLPYKLSADTFVHINDSLNSSNGNENQIETSRLISQSMHAVQELYSKRLQSFVSRLDSFYLSNSECVFLDSYSFTQLLHYYGLNCRHLGDLYILSETSFSQDLILIEAIARCCKSIVNRTLRGLLKTKLEETDNAVKMHPTSNPNYDAIIFTQQNSNYIAARKNLITKLFNVILGSSKISQDFWRGPLGELFEKKYGMPLPHDHNLHYPQLFQSLQYHLGVVFQDRSYGFPYANTGRQFYRSYDTGSSKANLKGPLTTRHTTEIPQANDMMELSVIFTESDVLYHDMPLVKYWTPFPGPFLYSYDVGVELKRQGLYRDALSVFRMVLSVYYTSWNYSPSYLSLDPQPSIKLWQGNANSILSSKTLRLITETEYHYVETLYLAGLYDDCRIILNAYRQDHLKHSTMSIRILTLFMKLEYQSGKYSISLDYYAEAMELTDYLYGNHSIRKIQLTIELAELYCQSIGYSSDAIEDTIGYISKIYESYDRVDQKNQSLLLKIRLGNRLCELYYKEQLYQESLEELLQIQIDLDRLKQYWDNKIKRSPDQGDSPMGIAFDREYATEKGLCYYYMILCQYQNKTMIDQVYGNCLTYLETIQTKISSPGGITKETGTDTTYSSPEHLSSQRKSVNNRKSLRKRLDSSSSVDNESNIPSKSIKKTIRMTIEVITIKRIIADILCHQQKYDSAMTQLTECWSTCVTYPRDYENAGLIIVELSYQLVSILLNSLATDSKRYLETIESHITTNEGRVSDMNLWNECSDIVVRTIWSQRAKEYIMKLVGNLQGITLDGRIHEKRISKEGLRYVYQTGVLVRMSKQFVIVPTATTGRKSV